MLASVDHGRMSKLCQRIMAKGFGMGGASHLELLRQGIYVTSLLVIEICIGPEQLCLFLKGVPGFKFGNPGRFVPSLNTLDMLL